METTHLSFLYTIVQAGIKKDTISGAEKPGAF